MKKKLFKIVTLIVLALGISESFGNIISSTTGEVQTVQAARRRTRRRRTRRYRTRKSRRKALRAGQIRSDTGKPVIGNRRTHICHLRSQQGYRMNRSNAVYFSSLAAAKRAGYRLSLR